MLNDGSDNSPDPLNPHIANDTLQSVRKGPNTYSGLHTLLELSAHFSIFWEFEASGFRRGAWRGGMN
eukprot:3361575-Amphidinium_carterae.1